jgi:hypothetical protein
MTSQKILKNLGQTNQLRYKNSYSKGLFLDLYCNFQTMNLTALVRLKINTAKNFSQNQPIQSEAKICFPR